MKRKIYSILMGALILTSVFSPTIYASDNLEEAEPIYIDLKTEKVETNYISMNSFIDTTNSPYTILSSDEVETLFNSIGEKSFKEIAELTIDHENKIASIYFMVNEDDGNINTLISSSIYNFLRGTKECVTYTIEFHVTGRYTDSNGRYMKKPLYIYTYKPESLITIDYDNIEFSNICSMCNEIWDENAQELYVVNKAEEASLQLKVLNILKYYVSEKIS